MSAHLLFDDEAGEVSASSSGTVSATGYGVQVDTTGQVNIDGLVQNVMGYLDSKIPSWVSQTVGMAAEWAGDVVLIDGAVTTFASAVGAGVIATGPFAPVAATVMAIPALLIALAPAQGGMGCCGGQKLTSQQAAQMLSSFGRSPTFAEIINLQRFGSCAAAEFGWYGTSGPGSAQCDGQWAGDHWTGGCPRKWRAASTWEAFVGNWIISAYEASTDCWSLMRPQEYAVALAQAIGIWNRAHMGPATRVVQFVNMPGISSWQGRTTATAGNPVSYDPIPYSLNLAAQKWGQDANKNIISEGFLAPISGLASFTVNTGPAWSAPRPPLRLGIGGGGRPSPSPAPAPSSGGTAIAVGAGTVAALVALKVAAPATFAKIAAPLERALRRVKFRR